MVHHHVTGLFIIVLNQLLTCSISKSDQSLISPYKIWYIFKQKVTRTKKINHYMYGILALMLIHLKVIRELTQLRTLPVNCWKKLSIVNDYIYNNLIASFVPATQWFWPVYSKPKYTYRGKGLSLSDKFTAFCTALNFRLPSLQM